MLSFPEKAQKYCLYLLARRRYTRRQIITKLHQKQYPVPVIAEVIEKLERWGYLNDTEYAESFVHDQVRFKPKSRRAILYELQKRGIEKNTAVTALEKMLPESVCDEETLALKALSKKIQGYRKLPKEKGIRQAGDFLLRQGFSYDIIRKVIRRNWHNIPE